MAETRIREALDLLRREGWIQGDLYDTNGGHCIVGALRRVHNAINTGPDCMWPRRLSEEVEAIRNVITEQYPEEFSEPAAFNDIPGRKFSEVERVMEKAAILRESEI